MAAFRGLSPASDNTTTSSSDLDAPAQVHTEAQHEAITDVFVEAAITGLSTDERREMSDTLTMWVNSDEAVLSDIEKVKISGFADIVNPDI